MRVFVKEKGNFTSDKVLGLFNANVEIRTFTDMCELCSNDYIMISAEEDELSEDFYNDNHVIVYQEYIKRITQNIFKEYNYRHDYYYLYSALNGACSENVTTIISGSSYGAFGIDPAVMENVVNLSSISQDIYYSFELIKKTCSRNKNIKYVVMCFFYYALFNDLSLTKNEDELQRVSKVYYPLLGDTHNCFFAPPAPCVKYESSYINIEQLVIDCFKDDYKKGFFSCERPREFFATKLWYNKEKNWQQLSKQERLEAGKMRAERHNASLKSNRKATFNENVGILQDLSKFCTERNINLIMVVPPVTKDYLNYIDPSYKEYYYETLNSIEGVINVLDLADDPDFDDVSDMNDMDHLGVDGAKKFSKKIMELIKTMQKSI